MPGSASADNLNVDHLLGRVLAACGAAGIAGYAMTASPMARALIFAIVSLSAAVGSWCGPRRHGVEHRSWFAFGAGFVTFALAEALQALAAESAAIWLEPRVLWHTLVGVLKKTIFEPLISATQR